MFKLFQRKPPVVPRTEVAVTAEKVNGFTNPKGAAVLLATPRRQKLLEHIWRRTSLPRGKFASLYQVPLERYAELVQQFPASESHHHAYQGGMLDHGLEIVAYALKLRQSYLLPTGSTPEDQAEQAEAWTAATAYASLLHDIGKLAVDLSVEQSDGATWHPWHGPLQLPYRFRYRENREYRLHSAATGLLYNQLLNREILDWLSGYPALWSALLYVLAGQYEYAGVLGELVVQADRASVAQELGGDPARAITAPKHALQRKLLDGLRYLVKHELKLNQPEASDGWITQNALWLVSKTVSDKLRAHLLSQGMDGIPSNNTAIFNVLQEHGLLVPTKDDRAIWRAAVNNNAGWSHSFTLLQISPALFWQPNERPASFSGTVTTLDDQEDIDAAIPLPSTMTALPAHSNATAHWTASDDGETESIDGQNFPGTQAVDDLLSIFSSQEEGTAENSSPRPKQSPSCDKPSVSSDERSFQQPPSPATLPSAKHFIFWLKQGLQSHRILINDAKALVHTVAETAYLVSPGVFQRYAQEHPAISSMAKAEEQQNWQWIQKQFEKLQIHRKQQSGLNIWTCEVVGPRRSRKLHGYLLDDPRQIFNECPPNNPYLQVL
ncbi:TraI domain-containing protein [Pseudomonas aeruginosa]|uniref:MobH family relaxase n=1 Tax=Citrobacter freundii TaxID=546 RepID=UPI001BD0D34D|nr:MobH family relaxase [Citrobacter freundii]MBN0649870.1 TraI domain-containing protein [Pseudomonas aeruginosa]